jgi:hypothetical protein
VLYFALDAWEYPCWKGNGMSPPELPVVAEGEGSRGERWYLKAGGSSEDYYTMLGTVHPDGRRDEGGRVARRCIADRCRSDMRSEKSTEATATTPPMAMWGRVHCPD